MPATPKVAVVTFPGSNGDYDAYHALEQDLGYETEMIDYRVTDLDRFDAVVLPGGFSYGDALRAGAIARFAPAMPAIRDLAESGRPVLGICNGFQILCEAHLLPGALLRNKSLRFHCHWTHIKLDESRSTWTRDLDPGTLLRLPVAHGQGSYYIDQDGLRALEEHGQIVARYADAHGRVADEHNPNGSVDGIAAICNRAGNVMGLMPHPERATNVLTGGDDGRRILEHIRSAIVAPNAAVA